VPVALSSLISPVQDRQTTRSVPDRPAREGLLARFFRIYDHRSSRTVRHFLVENLPSRSNSMRASSKPSHRRASGNHALQRLSLALNSMRPQSRPRPSLSRSAGREVVLRFPSGNGSCGLASMSTLSVSTEAAAARYPTQWVMDPATPPGQSERTCTCADYRYVNLL
jgi:hypothetical protein